MKYLTILLFLPIFSFAQNKKAPDFALGNFTDDYKITYTINDTLWVQHPNTKYHIIKWNKRKQYLVAKNDALNSEDADKYTRIDYMTFSNMEPYLWGFCLTVYDAATEKIIQCGFSSGETGAA